MSHDVACFRCGASLAALSLPLSRQDACPACSTHLHVCKMCKSYDASVTGQCLEDDAEEVFEKERLNFCDWFVAGEGRFDAAAKAEADKATQELNALFGEADAGTSDEDAQHSAAEKLFK